jgi:hypothetical protein
MGPISCSWGFVAVIMSWAVNKSVGWAIFHFFVGFFYVPYWLIRYTSFIDYVTQWVVR